MITIKNPQDSLTETTTALVRRYGGKLLRRQEIDLSSEELHRLTIQGHFNKVPSITEITFHKTCQRCYNQKTSLFGTLPCLVCNKDCLYCRKCINMGRILACEPLYYWRDAKLNWPSIEQACVWEGELTDQQHRGASRLVSAIQGAESELLIWGVCGAGKTEMLFPGINEALKLGKRICIASPRSDVVRELVPRLRTSFLGVPIEGLYGGSEDKAGAAQVILATTHQLLRYRDAFDVLIIDEVDAFPYHNDTSLPLAAERSKRIGSTTVYLTATPRKNHQKQIKNNTLPHIFIPVRFHGHPLPVPQLRLINQLQKDLTQFQPPKQFMTDLKQRQTPRRQILIFISTIQLAENIEANLTKALLKAKIIKHADELQSVHAEDPLRQEKVEQFRAKDIYCLVTTTILERGVTFPAIDVYVLDAGHTVFDEAALVQIAGRAGRSPVDPTGDVVFYHDGRTRAIVQSVKSIRQMNKRGGF